MLIKNHYCYETKLQVNFVVFPLIFSLAAMNLQQFFFKRTMKVNVVIAMEPPFHVNLLIQLQRTLSIFQVLKNYFLKFFKLAKIVAVQILGVVEDEHTFSTFSCMKSKFWNRLCEHFTTIMALFPNLSSH